jgi:hypothetical protein
MRSRGGEKLKVKEEDVYELRYLDSLEREVSNGSESWRWSP